LSVVSYQLSERPSSRRALLPFFATLVFFFVSGACGLLYQVVWTRQFVLLFGATAYAVGTVLSVFFLGLGAGSLWGGRLADRSRRPLFLYGAFEIIIGLWAVLLIALLDLGESAVVAVLSAFTTSRGAAIASRALLALVFLIVPVTLMGATLPLLAKFVTDENRVRGLRIGVLYSLNTFGAVTGCAVTGFVLLAALGYTRATLVGAAANIAVGIAAIALAQKVGALTSKSTGQGHPSFLEPRATVENAAEEARSSQQSAVSVGNLSPGLRGVVLAAFAVSGFCGLALEVLWTRLLVIIFLGTTYAFTTMLATLLCGIAAGSAAASAVVDRCRHQTFLFGIVEMLLGIACLLMLAVFAGLPGRLQEFQVSLGFDWRRLLQAKFVLAFSVLFAPTFLFGMTFPLVVKALAVGRPKLGRDVGRLYSVNTFGGVAGSLAGGYLLIPLLGTHRGLVLLAVTLFAVGMVLVLASPLRLRLLKGVAIVAGAATMGLVYGLAVPDDVCRALNAGYVPKDHNIVHYREGVEATVLVSEPADARPGSDRTLWINAVPATASIEKGVKMNRFQGVLPMLFDREPRQVLFMCFGSGITAGTLGLWDFDRIDAVEIARDVLDAAPLFSTDNFDVANNPNIHFIVDDGRNFLLTTANKYDVITFEPMPLALAGVSTFYAREYYELCLRRLAPGGLVSQWVPLHSLNAEIVQSLVYTFTQVFPEYCAWFLNADLFIVGSDQPLYIDYARVRDRLARPAVAAALAEVGLRDVPEVLTLFFMGKANIDAYAQGGHVMVDDRPWAEFLAPKLVYERRVPETLDAIIPYFEGPTAILKVGGLEPGEAQAVLERIDRRTRAKAHDLIALRQYYGGFVGERPAQLFIESLEIDPDDYNARYYLTQIALARARLCLTRREPEEAVEILANALKYAPNQAELHLMIADVHFDRRDFEKAREYYRAYLALGGGVPHARERSQ